MRIVTLEEHFTIPALMGRVSPDAIAKRGFPPTRPASIEAKLADLDAGRLADMDEASITVQVLSVIAGPGADLVDGDAGVALARDINDHLATAIGAHPDRLAGFAHLPMRSPQAAADELERSVRDLGLRGALINGLTQERFLDDPRFDPILARAAALDVPIYLHPSLPPRSVREAYYGGLPGMTGFRLASSSWGWHSEVALHVLRLIVSGTLDRHRKLKLIIGHMGEGLAAMLARTDRTLADNIPHLTRSVAQTVRDQLWVTTSGLFTRPPFDVALALFGIDRLMFSIDYPIVGNLVGRNFLDTLKLPAADMEKLAHGNADRLLKLSPGAEKTKTPSKAEMV
jgi:uncharacterized protein